MRKNNMKNTGDLRTDAPTFKKKKMDEHKTNISVNSTATTFPKAPTVSLAQGRIIVKNNE